ncbi:hypothetical protein [Nocardia sp. NPDC051750]|uniref:hypothetical protein n=1 Tax=Nocardia sp. NPDC051750 TaxID=3364325 RepID=UPI0037AD4A68
MGEVFNHLVRLLEVFAEYLDKLSPWGVPWPVTIACIFPVIMAILATMVWWSRGRVWRVKCEYTGTHNGSPCQRPVRGEWHRCFQHRPGQARSGGDRVDARFRWETKRDGRFVEREDVRGKGFVRADSQSRSLLYHRGFARPPRAVRRFWRTWWSYRRDDLRKLRDQLQEAGGIDLLTIFRGPAGASARAAVNDQLAVVIQATRIVLLLVFTGLVLVGIALWRNDSSSLLVNYAATLVFIGAWMVARWGIWGTTSGEVSGTGGAWKKKSWRQTWSWFGSFLIISVLAGELLKRLEMLVSGPVSIRFG